MTSLKIFQSDVSINYNMHKGRARNFTWGSEREERRIDGEFE